MHAADRAPAVDGFRLKPGTRVGLYRGANNMPGGWLMWMLEQYGINHQVVTAQDFQDLAAKYDVILLVSGITEAAHRQRPRQKRNDPAEFGWAAGVGEAGWGKLQAFVENGGTLLAIGTAVETARELLDLPIEKALPEARAALRSGRAGGRRGGAATARTPSIARCATPSAARRS